MRAALELLRHHVLVVGFALAALLITVAFLVVFIPLTDVPRFAQIDLPNDTRIIVEVADTLAKRTIGLSGRPSMQESDGMLFLFDERGIYTFWMYGMEFPLDFIWLKDDRIVDFDEDVPVDSEFPLERYAPDEPVDRMLEVNAGFIRRNTLQIGDQIRIQLSD